MNISLSAPRNRLSVDLQAHAQAAQQGMHPGLSSALDQYRIEELQRLRRAITGQGEQPQLHQLWNTEQHQ